MESKKQILSKLEQALIGTQEICPNLKGFIIYGDFVTKPNPKEVDIMFLYQKRPVVLLMSNKDEFDSIEKAKEYLKSINPNFNVNHSHITGIECRMSLNYELNSKSIKKYYFIGDEETHKRLKQIIPDKESVSF